MLLYIHIPFCDSKCHYCAFNSYTSLHALKDNYMQALLKQLLDQLKKYDKKIETVFIGGGTPSTVEASYYKQIMKIIKPCFTKKNIEVTIEANPNSANKKWLQEIFETGINRISFGVQSFDEDKLQFLGRNHNKTQAIKAIEDAFDVGFENINCDLIYDTAYDTKTLLQNDINTIKNLPVNHVSAYSLTLEEGTKFYNKSSVKLENEENAKFIFQELHKIGFSQYEISNFALNDQAKSKHNLGYWQYKEYLGIGSGAVGCMEAKRFYTQKDVIKYIQDPLIHESIEELSKEDILLEKIFLGLRSEVGVAKKILSNDQWDRVLDLVETYKGVVKDNIFYNNNFIIADEMAFYIEGAY